MRSIARSALSRLFVLSALLGSVAALGGCVWDDGHHHNRGWGWDDDHDNDHDGHRWDHDRGNRGR